MGLFMPKILQAEVTGGVDLESSVLFTGDRITVGSGAGDTLRLGAAGIVPGHLTFEKGAGGHWEYFSADRGVTGIDRGNPRTGRVRPGMWFDLGYETRLTLTRVPAPPEIAEKTGAGEKTTVPVGIALPVLGLMVVGAAAAMNFSGGSKGTSGLRTTPWFTGAADIAPALETCLDSGLSPEAASISGNDALSADADFRAALRDPDAGSALAQRVRGVIAETHLLTREGRYDEAARSIRRMENVLPVGNGDCPILAAARADLTVLTIQADRAFN
jgi:hypothetical protein